jgi:tetratricopeptide (TPR) repeat protein
LLFVAAVGPVMLVGLGLMLYNALRFDSPFEFGWHHQLTSYQNNTARQFSLHYLCVNFRFYFLEPMRWSGHFPFLQAWSLSPLPSGYCGFGLPYSGILSNYPVAWLALAAPLAWRGRSVEEVSALRWFVAAVFLFFVICALTLCLFFSAGSSYELDFLPALMLLAVIGIFGLERVLAGSPVWRRIARWSWCLLLAYTVVFNILASVEAHATTNFFVGNSFVSQGRVGEAVERFQKALELEPESASFRVCLADAYCKIGRVDEAMNELQKALKIEPDSVDIPNNIGAALYSQGHSDEAIVCFQKALQIQPDSIKAHNNLGVVLCSQGRFDEAIHEFQESLRLRPDCAEASNNLVNTLGLKEKQAKLPTHSTMP